MLQYLLNATAIWLISLVMFDVFLRRESYHSYNRFYLLFTFLLGVFLPLLHWQQNISASYPAIGKPLQQVIVAKQTIAATAIPATSTVNWQLWLTIIYLSGVVVALCLLVIEIIKLLSANKGKRSQQDGWTVIETGKEHAPFSFRNTLFVCSRVQYNNEEWAMILTHEKRHTTLFHIADLFLMQLARILFWFHPLVYLYNNRLLLVHEYQADNTSAQQPQVYGRFLVEQAILQSAPALSHSFNRSPIKNRIVMLTRRSSDIRYTKLLLIFPLLLASLLCFTKTGYSFKGDKNKIMFRGNEFEFGFDKQEVGTTVGTPPAIADGHAASILKTINPENGAKMSISFGAQPHGDSISVNFFSAPLKMNGKKIYSDDEVATQPMYKGSVTALGNYLIIGLTEYLQELNDGSYEIEVGYPIFDEQGNLVYYENKGLVANDGATKVDPDLKQKINNKIAELLDAVPAYQPATINGQPVIVYEAWAEPKHIILKDHKVTVEK